MSLNSYENQTNKKALQANKTELSSKDKIFFEKIRKEKKKKQQKNKKEKVEKNNKCKVQVMVNAIRSNTTTKKRPIKNKASQIFLRLLTIIVIKKAIILPIIANRPSQKT